MPLGRLDADAPLSRFQAVFGTGLRYVFEWRGQWLSLAGWQTGAFKSAPRDRWVGWKGKIRYERLHLIGNNTRFLALGAPEALEAVLRRYSAPRLQVGKAVAADGKRVRAANRHSADHYESITLVEHGTGQPVNSLTIPLTVHTFRGLW